MDAEHPYAGFKPRIAAILLDFFIIAIYAVVLFVVRMILSLATSFDQLVDSAIARDFVAFVTLILPVVLYFSLQESSGRQATVGKLKMGLQVITTNGDRLTIGQALLRSGLKFLPWQMAHTAVFQILSGNTSAIILFISILAQALVIVYLVTLLIDKRHHALYDRLAGTSVVIKGRSVKKQVAAI